MRFNKLNIGLALFRVESQPSAHSSVFKTDNSCGTLSFSTILWSRADRISYTDIVVVFKLD